MARVRRACVSLCHAREMKFPVAFPRDRDRRPIANRDDEPPSTGKLINPPSPPPPSPSAAIDVTGCAPADAASPNTHISLAPRSHLAPRGETTIARNFILFYFPVSRDKGTQQETRREDTPPSSLSHSLSLLRQRNVLYKIYPKEKRNGFRKRKMILIIVRRWSQSGASGPDRSTSERLIEAA